MASAGQNGVKRIGIGPRRLFSSCKRAVQHGWQAWPRKNRYRARQFIASQKQEKWSQEKGWGGRPLVVSC